MSHPPKPDRKSLPADGAARDSLESGSRSPGPPSLWLLALLAALSASVVLLLGAPFGSSTAVYQAGDIAHEDVKATRDFLMPDEEATEARRHEAEASSPSVYDLNPNALEETLTGLKGGLETLDDAQAGPDGPLPFEGEKAAHGLESQWDVAVSAELARQLADPKQREAFVEGVRSSLQSLYARGVVANRSLLLSEEKRGVVVRNLATREEAKLSDPSGIVDFDDARRGLAEASGPAPLETFARRVAGSLLRPNLSYNSEESAARRMAAREDVKPVLYQIRKGEMLVREGDRVSQEQEQKLVAHAPLAQEGRGAQAPLGLFLLTSLTLYLTYLFARGNVKKFRRKKRDLVFLSVLFLFMLTLESAGSVAASALSEAFPGVGQDTLTYALPIGAACIVVRVILNSETAVLFSLPYFALAALSFDQKLGAFFCFLLGGLVGAHRAARACRRIDFLQAGLWAGLAQAGVALCLALLEGGALEASTKWGMATAFTGGVLGGVLSLCLVPLAEWAFGYTTEIRLMELATLDHPLLRQLMLRAPGTYHHSIVTGSLVKAAGEAIGARALLANVAAYYHDIGKISKPAYFIENQGDGHNPHDKLAPSMSSLILHSHVKEGVELARRYRLGRDIVDIIQQHHGTSLIQFFYEKACERVRKGVDAVSESHFRYPGPKPQTREAALILLADAVEAASRTVPDPKPARIRGMVQNIINRTFTDGQLDECDLTLSDLHEIARSFSRILTGIHHQRIDYPLAAQKEKTADADLDPKRLSNGRSRRGEVSAQGSEVIKRLGM